MTALERKGFIGNTRTENIKTATAFLLNNKAINNHNGKETVVDGLIFFKDDKKEHSGYYTDTRYFSVNPLLVDPKDNRLHICTWSNGGSIVNTGNIEQDILKYNNSLMFPGGRIDRVLLSDGTKIQCPADEWDFAANYKGDPESLKWHLKYKVEYFREK